ncbi:GldG family protein [bacterium]|nr:GldG family protein [candidate division CSSED10-310 bacterium]
MKPSAERFRKTGLISGIFAIFAVAGILVVLNMIAARHDTTFDLTSNRRFTLSEQSVQVLNGLDDRVQATSFFRETDEAFEIVKDLLDQYRDASKAFSYRSADLDKEPMLGKRFDITSDQTIVLEYGNRFRKIVNPTEHDVTNALIRLTRGDDPKRIIFTRGNGELDIDSLESGGLGFLKAALSDMNYSCESMNLMTVEAVPSDCALLAVIGPESDPVEDVVAMIRQFVTDGGRLFIALEPGKADRFRDMLADFGIHAGNDVIIDPKGFQSTIRPIIEAFEEHPVTEGFDYGLVLHEASSMQPLDPPKPGWHVMKLALTSVDSWSEAGPVADTPVFDPGLDTQGPLSVITIATASGKTAPEQRESRVLAIGDASFVSNIFFQTFAAHAPFILNACHWLADEHDLIAIPPKEIVSQPLLLQTPQLAVGLVVPVIIMPLLVALFGTVRIWTRRHHS